MWILRALTRPQLELPRCRRRRGKLGCLGHRLATINAVVINRWLDYAEVSALISQYDCMVLSNIEASQSGVVALAYGLGMPVIATPVGGLSEQIRDGELGLMAQSVSAPAIADAMQLFLQDAQLRARLLKGVAQAQTDFSMARFFQSITARGRPDDGSAGGVANP